jgi:hypothetical protein
MEAEIAFDRPHFSSPEPRYQSSPDEDVAKSRNGLRRSHPFQEEIMHMTKGWSGLRTAVIALSLFAWTTTGVKAAPLLYSTSGGLNLSTSDGISGTNVISFNGVSPSTIDPNSNVPLGSLQVAALPDGATTTYTNTPFQISFIPTTYDGMSLTGLNAVQPITLMGTLNGSVTGSTMANVSFSINSVSNGAFDLLGVPSTLNVPLNVATSLVPSSAGATTNSPGGITTLEGSITSTGSPGSPSAAPEPSTIALFLSTIGGLGLRRYVLSRRRQNKV